MRSSVRARRSHFHEAGAVNLNDGSEVRSADVQFLLLPVCSRFAPGLFLVCSWRDIADAPRSTDLRLRRQQSPQLVQPELREREFARRCHCWRLRPWR